MTDEPGTELPPHVSVIIPFLDPPLRFFEEAVESVFAQEYPDWELILVNDGSGPEATSFAEALASAHPDRVRLCAHPGGTNVGLAASRNLGLENARGELIACLDSDDVWKPIKLAEQVRILDSRPHVDMVFGRSIYWRSWEEGSENTDYHVPLGVPDRTEMSGGEFFFRILRSQIMVPCPSSLLVRRAAAVTAGGFGEGVSNLYEDQAFYAKIGLSGVVLACEAEWDQYRLHEASLLGRASRAESLAARRQFLSWVRRRLEGAGLLTPSIRRTLRLERWATYVPRGVKVLHHLRRLRWD